MCKSEISSRFQKIAIFSVFFITYLLFYILNSKFNWPILRLGDAWFDKSYDDTDQILRSLDCYVATGRNIYQESSCSFYIYGVSLLEFLKFFGVTSTAAIGNLFFIFHISIYAFFSFLIYNIYGLRSCLISVLICTSPPSHYLIERGNFDTMVIFLLLLSTYLFYKKNYFLSSIFLSFASLIKFYSLPLFFVYLLLLFMKKDTFLKYNLLFFTCTFVLVLRDILALPVNLSTSFGGYGGTFGMRIFLVYAIEFSSIFKNNFLTLIYLLFFLLLFLLVFTRYSFRYPFQDANYSLSTLITIIFGFQFIISFVSGLNNDYRLVFLSIFLLSLQLELPRPRARNFYILFFGISSLWLSYPAWIFQVVGDVFLAISLFLIFDLLLSLFFTKKVTRIND
jgi:hypothetical protein